MPSKEKMGWDYYISLGGDLLLYLSIGLFLIWYFIIKHTHFINLTDCIFLGILLIPYCTIGIFVSWAFLINHNRAE